MSDYSTSPLPTKRQRSTREKGTKRFLGIAVGEDNTGNTDNDNGQNLVGNEPEDDRGHDTLASSLQQSNKRQPARSSIRRPSKRQRKGKGKATMRFLDVEAAPGDSSEDESTEESESHEENGNNTVYRRDITINERDLVNTETTNEQVYERHLHALSEPRIIEETDWEALLESAKGRGKKANPSTGDDTWYSDEVILRVRATEFLWEIQCTPGKEETFCDKIRKQSTDSSSTSSRPNYIYGHEDLPGRIYVEMNTHLEAVNFAQSYADLYSSGMKRVPSDTMLQRVSLRDRTYSPQTWATICRDSGKWKIYEGDTALIALRGSHLVAIIIPRIAIHSTEKKATRPHPKPCKWSDICSHSGNATEVGHQEHYTYMGYYFSPDGFIITDISDIQLTPPHERPIPTSEVLQAFRASAFLAQSTYQQTEREIAQRQIEFMTACK
ncbi:hypothetical protein BJ912DRAFT_935726 [Pholiota molesta]|nr:hypothetical protein BJ912DRAFT_935726 [Pholiota molesta]